MNVELTTTSGATEIDADALASMRERGGDWFAYQNVALDSAGLGHMTFLKCGPGCVLATPPQRHPDLSGMVMWKYMLRGRVDLQSGKVVAL